MLRAVYFTASWCAPCRTFKPVASAVLNYHDIPFDYVDVDTDPALAAANTVMSIPTIVFYGDDGNEVDRLAGASEKLLNRMVDEVMHKYG
jgi:thioredoxin 1